MWQKLLKYLGVYLLEKILAYLKEQYRLYKEDKRLRELEKTNLLKAEKYEQAKDPDSAFDDFRNMP
jgi:hypothetical protein